MSHRVKCVICGESVLYKETDAKGWCVDCVDEFNRLPRRNPNQEELFQPVNGHDHDPPKKVEP